MNSFFGGMENISQHHPTYMNKWFFSIFLTLSTIFAAHSQEEIAVDQLINLNNFPHYANDSTWNCGDSLFWSFIRKGEEIIPELIQLVADSTRTDVEVPCTDHFLTKGDIAFFVLSAIVRLPFREITGSQWCTMTVGCDFGYPDGWFDYVNTHRSEFQANLEIWYNRNKKKLKTVKIKPKEKTQCERVHQIESKVIKRKVVYSRRRR